MIWYLFLILALISGFFLIIGYTQKTRLWIQLGALFLIVFGLGILTSGLDVPNGTKLNDPNYLATGSTVDFGGAIIPLNGCDSNISLAVPKFCIFDVNADYYKDFEFIEIDVMQNGMLGKSNNYNISTIKTNNTFSVYLTNLNLPTYILASGVDVNQDKTYLDEINLVGGYDSLNIEKTYLNIDKESITAKWLLGLLSALLGMMLFFDSFFNDRFQRYI
jgi:hypothetical protein